MLKREFSLCGINLWLRFKSGLRVSIQSLVDLGMLKIIWNGLFRVSMGQM